VCIGGKYTNASKKEENVEKESPSVSGCQLGKNELFLVRKSNDYFPPFHLSSLLSSTGLPDGLFSNQKSQFG
jgi:hypothetical protein